MTIGGVESRNNTRISIDVPNGSYPEVMEKAVFNLETLNKSYGNMFFATLGKDNRKTFLFPTSRERITSEGKNKTVKSQFLVFTAAEGFKIIESGTDKKSRRDANVLHDFIASRIGANPTGIDGNGTGYEANRLVIWRVEDRLGGKDKSFSVTPEGSVTRNIRWGHAISDCDTSTRNQTLKLMDASEDSVRQILELNLTRVKSIQGAISVVAGIS